MTYAYLRQLSDNHSLAIQQKDILAYATANGLEIDKEVMEYSSASHKIDDRDKFELFIQSLTEEDSIVIQSLWVLSNHIEEIVKIINCMLRHDVSLHIARNKCLINRDTSITVLFPLLNTLNEERRQKKRQIGRPKGSRSSSKFDSLQSEIVSCLRENISVSAIARKLDVSRSSLKDYIVSRELKQLALSSWNKRAQEDAYDNNHMLLICPFEANQIK